MKEKQILNREIEKRNFNKGGEVSSRLKTLLTRLGISPAIIRRASIITYELEMNIIIHSEGGNIEANVTGDKIVIIARDTGPGIEDVNQALEPGFSTADEEIREMGFGAGMGLNNVKKYGDKLDIDSVKGEYTVVKSTIQLDDRKDK